MININQIRDKIISAIKNSGLTQKEIANKLGVCQQTISHYFNGTKLPTLDTFANLCVALDLDPAEILCVK